MRKPAPPTLGAIETNYRHLAEIAAQDAAERQKGIKLLRVVSGSPNLPYIALTFDDGPHGEKTSILLDMLKEMHCPSTFFLVGAQARRYPSLVQRIAAEGHEIGNHTFNHYRLTRIPTEEIAGELTRTRDLLRAIVGAPSRLFRPPGGEYSPEILKIVERNGFTTVLWTNDPADYKLHRTAADVQRLVLRDITPGGIILLHDGVRSTLKALPGLVRSLREKGYIFVTVSSLIQRGGGLDLVKNISFSRTSARER